MLSNKAAKFLRHLSRHTEYREYMQLEKDYKGFDEVQFWAVYDAGFLDIHPHVPLPDDVDLRRKYLIGNTQFRINDAGVAYLESISWRNWEEIRAWLAIVFSFAAIVVSVISILE